MSYNLLSVPAATEHSKTVLFEDTTCRILDGCKLIDIAIKSGELFYLNCNKTIVSTNVADTQTNVSVDDV